MSEKLTHDDIAKLRAPFQPNQHDFLRGFTYVKEYAVTARLEEIDPAWSFEIIETKLDTERQQVHVTARMTVKGSVRDGIGTQAVEQFKSGYNEAEKSAATDALKRCARMFGVGRYLTEISSKDKVKDISTLGVWINRNFGEDQPQQPPAPTATATAKHWILDAERYGIFVEWCVEEGITKEEIPVALDVDNRSDFTGTNKEAAALVRAFAGSNNGSSNGDKPPALQTTMANGAKFMQNKKGGDFTALLFDGKDTGVILGTRAPLRKVSKTIENYVNRWEHGETYDFTADLIVSHTGNEIHSISEDIPL